MTRNKQTVAPTEPIQAAPPDLLSALRDLIQQGRQQALRAVDMVQVQTCWEIGRHMRASYKLFPFWDAVSYELSGMPYRRANYLEFDGVRSGPERRDSRRTASRFEGQQRRPIVVNSP